MGAREDKTFLIVTIAVFVIAIGSIVLMVRPIVPGLPPTPPMLTGQVFAVGDPIHSGYAPPWELDDSELFYDISEPDYTGLTAEDEITISVSIDRPGAFIYKRILYYNEKNSDWVSLGDAAWTKDAHELEIEFTLDELSEDNYLLAYTCLYDDDKPDKWDCGCKSVSDTSCRAYTIQSFKGPELTTPPVVDTCTTNADCREIGFSKYDANKRYCKQTTGECVECKQNSHCPAGKECTNNVCTLVAGTGCTSDNDCSGSTPKCHIPLGECYECLTNGDCTGTDYCDEGSCEVNTTSTPTGLEVTGSSVVHKHAAMAGCHSPALTTPTVTGFVYDHETGGIYTNDHAGMVKFKVNKLQSAIVTIRDMFGGTSGLSCKLDGAAQTVSGCIAYSGDTAGCIAPRAQRVAMVGEGVVHVDITHLTTHPDSILLFSDADGSFDIDVEYGNAKRAPNGAFSVARSNGKGDALVGGTPNFKGNYLQFFDTGSKRYGILGVQTGYASRLDFEDLRLIDITNTYNPVDLGRLSQHAPLDKIFAQFCTTTGTCYPSSLNWILQGVEPTKHVIVKEGNQYKLYDYTDPTYIEEVDSFTCNSAFCYEGMITGLRSTGSDRETATLEGDTIYVHIPGGAAHKATVKKDYPELNPIKVNKCHSRGSSPCYFGQVWKHKIGTNGWTKALDVPGVRVQIRDGILWLFGDGYGSHMGPEGIYDPSQVHQIDYSGRMYNANIFPGYGLAAYDLADGSKLMHEGLNVPSDAFRPGIFNSPPFAVMERNGKHYAYIFFYGLSNGANQFQQVVGYEVSGCTTCSGTPPGGGGTPPGGGGGGSSCSDPCTGSGSQCGPGTRDCYAFGIPGPQPQCAYERECVDGCWTYDVCSEGESCSSGQCTGNQAS